LINNPIILDENGCLLFFQSKDIAERYIEFEDVKNNEYVVYDSEGKLLKLELVEYKKSAFFGVFKFNKITVEIIAAEDSPLHQDELKQKIKKFIKKISPEEGFSNGHTLKELLEKATTLSGYSQ